MRYRGTHLQSKIAALLISLVALWAFAAYVTVQAGLDLLWTSTLDQRVGRPADALVSALQVERRASAVYLGSHAATTKAGKAGAAAARTTLIQARAATDEARSRLHELSGALSVRLAATDAVDERLGQLQARLDQLDQARTAIDANRGRATALTPLTTIIDAAFRVHDQLSQTGAAIPSETHLVVALSRSRELVAREDSLLSGALSAGTISAAELAAFGQVVGAQRAFYADAVAGLSDADRAGYDGLIATASFRRFVAVEQQVIMTARPGKSLPLTAGAWRGAVDPVLSQLYAFEQELAGTILTRARPAAIGVLVRLVLACGLGLLAVITSIIVSVTTGRRIVRQLERMREAALDLASNRLPRVVDRLQHGHRVDVAQEAPPLDFGTDEVAELGEAFNTVQQTAVRVAVEQAELRRSVRDVFLGLARRSQTLLHRQLGLLDAMERRSTDADELAELFRIDHLATRMRRNAENLIVLSGASAGRAWRRPIPMVDVLRAALAEVEDFTRVTVHSAGRVSLVGRAAADVIHLLAELIENAVTFSPPNTVVRLGGAMGANGFAVEIEDRGLGMATDELVAANNALQDPPEFQLSSTARLGLYVVAKLAARHGIHVRLAESAYGGTVAIVLLPEALIAEEAPPATTSATPAEGSEPAGQPAIASASAPSTVASAASRRAGPTVYTAAGLPFRQRHSRSATRSPGLDTRPVLGQPAIGLADGRASARGAAQVKDLISSYRAGIQRGRDDAASRESSRPGSANGDSPSASEHDDAR